MLSNRTSLDLTLYFFLCSVATRNTVDQKKYSNMNLNRSNHRYWLLFDENLLYRLNYFLGSFLVDWYKGRCFVLTLQGCAELQEQSKHYVSGIEMDIEYSRFTPRSAVASSALVLQVILPASSSFTPLMTSFLFLPSLTTWILRRHSHRLSSVSHNQNGHAFLQFASKYRAEAEGHY